ncbi:hypothetical protein B9Z55_007104 [Caenorhabditis nigoni]|uniref:C2H2-type domain-containing protein n=1 Tax=Caenorhabditis nigoni TaxID=1611254 RepID=A0A2G5V8A3_9PELO|nr:hypothetical protein B9Z55_007104 [Caenorhabditis nigoni]
MALEIQEKADFFEKIDSNSENKNSNGIIYTSGAKQPYKCGFCYKAFRFRSNAYDHQSVHTGIEPFQCPLCGKTTRLKGNLKKHMWTHATSKAELDAIWKPLKGKFKRNNSKMSKLPEKSIKVGGAEHSENFEAPKLKKSPAKLEEPENPKNLLKENFGRLENTIYSNPNIQSVQDLAQKAKSMIFEPYKCHVCHSQYMSRLDCSNHIEIAHPATSIKNSKFFCKKCFRPFSNQTSYTSHIDFHAEVVEFLRQKGHLLPKSNPQLLIPTDPNN